jgi:hypothetical protein
MPRIDLTEDELWTLQGMVAQWVDEGFTTPPYAAEHYAIFRKVGLTPEEVRYDIRPPEGGGDAAE